MNHNHFFSGKTYILKLLTALLLFGLNAHGQNAPVGKSSATITNDTSRITQYLKSSVKLRNLYPDSSLKLLDAARILAKKYDLQMRVGQTWCFIAEIYVLKGNYTIAKSYLDSAFILSAKLNDGVLICSVNEVAAFMYKNLADYAKAATYYYRALETIKKYNITNAPVVPDLYNNLGSLMFSLGEDSLARKYLLLSKYYQLQLKPVDSLQLMHVELNLGMSYFTVHTDTAISYFNRAYQQAKKYNDPRFTFHILLCLSKCYTQQAQFDSANRYLQLARKSAVNELSVIETEIVAGFLAFYQNDLNTAEVHLQKAITLDKGNDHDNMEEAYLGLSEIYKEHKQFQKALEYLQKYQDLNDKRMQGKGQKKIVADFMLQFQEMENEKQMLQKQAELKMKEAEIQKRNLWIKAMSGLVFLLFVILFLAYNNYRNRKKLLNERMQTLLQHQEIERLKAEAEGENVERSRIAYDLHDGVLIRLSNVKRNLNALSSSSPIILEDNHYNEIGNQLEIATRELRNTAHNLMPEILLENGLDQAIFYFCKEMEEASEVKIKFQHIGPSIPRLEPHIEAVIYRMVQGLIQNIIRHSAATTALVQVQYTAYLCSITIEDNGQGISEKSTEGYGLKSIRNRMKTLNGIFDIQSEAGKGTMVYLEIDVRPYL